MTTLYYFLQVIVCSGVLYGYYLLVLRNKQFHQYNRFYLLMILLVSWLVPLIKIPVKMIHAATSAPATSYKFFEVIADNNSHLEEYVSGNATSIDSAALAGYAYWLVSLVIAVIFLSGVIRVILLLRRSQSCQIDGAVIVNTSAKAAPFSFFHFIFWNDAIDVNSSVGRRILLHEMVHVNEKHTMDKIVTAIILCVGWFNPFFWFTRWELDMVHEFIADKKAVNGDASDLANMLLTAAYPSMNFHVTNSFFYSPVKRRISMMTKSGITKYPYLRRLSILPLAAIVVMLFAFRKQVVMIRWVDPVNEATVTERPDADTPSVVVTDILKNEEKVTADQPAELERVYKVMLDAGHGGHDGGAEGIDGTKESEVALEMVKTILEENTNSKIKILLTRATDEYQHPTVKADLTKKNHADLLVSIHAASSENKKDNGIELYIPTRDTLKNWKASYLFANTMANAIRTYDEATKIQIKQRQVGIWIINSAECPAVLVETGFLTNEADLKKLKDRNYQRRLARTILKGIEMYLKRLDGAG